MASAEKCEKTAFDGVNGGGRKSGGNSGRCLLPCSDGPRALTGSGCSSSGGSKLDGGVPPGRMMLNNLEYMTDDSAWAISLPFCGKGDG